MEGGFVIGGMEVSQIVGVLRKLSLLGFADGAVNAQTALLSASELRLVLGVGEDDDLAGQVWENVQAQEVSLIGLKM